MSQDKKSCYQQCNERFTSTQPQRLFCKKGCDSEQPKLQSCKQQTCNKLCIKSDQGQTKLWFNFLYRAPKNPVQCLDACIYGCIKKDQYQSA